MVRLAQTWIAVVLLLWPAAAHAADVVWDADHHEIQVLGLAHLTEVGVALYAVLILLLVHDVGVLVTYGDELRAVRGTQARNVILQSLLTQTDDTCPAFHATLPRKSDWTPR